MSKANQGGFTLIELVVVIVILGILSAFAVPRFMGLETQARAASVDALGGSVRSAASLAHSVWLASGNPASISVEGQTIGMTNGYPTAGDLAKALQDTTGFAVTTAAGTETFTRNGATVGTTCQVTYAPPTAAGEGPAIDVDSSDCK